MRKGPVLLRTEALAVGHGRKALMEGIRLELRAGTLTALVGINGIGKSTLLRTLAGLHPPLAGRVQLGQQEVHRMQASLRARHIAIVLTGRPATGMLDVETLVGLGRQPWTGRWGRLTEADLAAVERALEQTGATHLRHRPLAACSDGECQKVLIARVLAQAAPVLLLDEPTAFLDLPNRAGIVRMLRAIAKEENKAVLFSTHDIQLALDLCDRIVLMQQDDGIRAGSPEEVMANGALERAFAGSGVQLDPIHGTHRFKR